MNNEVRGRGRPKGSKSFINVWLENLNIDIKEENKTEVKNQKQEPEDKIHMTLKQ